MFFYELRAVTETTKSQFANAENAPENEYSSPSVDLAIIP